MQIVMLILEMMIILFRMKVLMVRILEYEPMLITFCYHMEKKSLFSTTIQYFPKRILNFFANHITKIEKPIFFSFFQKDCSDIFKIIFLDVTR
jgi:hypothetical protein